MTTNIAIAENITTLRQVEEKLGLKLSDERQFFTEWMDDLPLLSEAEEIRLKQVRENYPSSVTLRFFLLLILSEQNV